MDEVMTVAEAAAMLGITPGAVRFRIARGDMKAQRVGARLLLIPVSEVERLRNAGKFKPGPKPRPRQTEPER